jgi:hypothetical protein
MENILLLVLVGYQDDEVNKFVMKALAATLDDKLTLICI